MQQPMFDPATEGMLAATGRPPLVALTGSITGWFEGRHLELMTAAGFDDVRRAHNAVFVNVPSAGLRLTELAAEAGMTKQAMSELVNDLIEKGYFRRVPDPDDGRAKLIVWAERGQRAHAATMRAFASIERELAEGIGDELLGELKARLLDVIDAIRARESGDQAGSR